MVFYLSKSTAILGILTGRDSLLSGEHGRMNESFRDYAGFTMHCPCFQPSVSESWNCTDDVISRDLTFN